MALSSPLLSVTVLLFLLVQYARCDFLTVCPSMCNCKWSSGRETMDCSTGQLTAVPTTISPEIKVLIMDGSYIRELGKDAFNSGHLQKISLKNCHIQRIHEEAFSNLKIVMEIYLDGNNLTKLAPKTFDGNYRLKTLVLTGNQLESLLPYQFPPLPELKKIDLSNSGLKEVSKMAFSNLDKSVEEVDLSGNFLTYLREDTFLSLKNLKLLNLARNPWVCDCRLQSLRDFVIHRNLFNPAANCAEPARLVDKLWNDVKSHDFACKPEIEVKVSRVHSQAGANVTLSCYITGNPVPSVR
jgi:Leucine-rich repeat (LRR) protein